MGYLDIMLRLGAAMLIGLAVGVEREHSQRPAGMRTHFLVAIGSAAVTVTGEMMTTKYGSDPMRLAAQVISGIGFLGAGTIIKEGLNIRGLTTAASLWVTACLAIVAGAGLYLPAAIGLFGILIAFTVMEKLEWRMNAGRRAVYASLEVTTEHATAFLSRANEVFRRHAVELRGMALDVNEEKRHIELRVKLPTRDAATAMLGDLANIDGATVSVTMD